MPVRLIMVILSFLLSSGLVKAEEPFVGIINMKMMILPGTSSFLEASIQRAHLDGAKAFVVLLDTPGGMLNTAQEMIQTIYRSPLPVIIYVSPSGSTATSAGVFITMAGHIAAMSPGTSIGAAHPVSGEGKDIEGDMRAKAENMAVAMVKSISEERGRNFEWAEKAVKESSSITEKEALKLGVVDVVAESIDQLLRQIKGKKVKLDQTYVTLEDYSSLQKRYYEMSTQQKLLNVLGNPNVLALLWIGATTGLSIELYNPGAILPGVVGVICLILALLVMQVIPVSQGALLLLIVGALLIGLELFIPSGILGVGGIIAMVLGAVYLVDVNQAPGMGVALEVIAPVALVCGGFLFFVVSTVLRSYKRRVTTGLEGLIGQKGRALDNFTEKGKVFVAGEVWSAVARSGLVQKDEQVVVIGTRKGLILEVEKQ